MLQKNLITNCKEKIERVRFNFRKISFPELSDLQLEGLANIFADAGQVFLAAMVILFFLTLDEANWGMLLSGLTATLGCWLMSLFIRRSL